ncbi:sensor histidine kinase [Hymenobacter sp. BT770]|uniref:sensor histidine kinase n=1 Tax=Hymenobacter sp. BT770 TaxID=2886942 RepID=UPI001D11BFCA|nr:sensor histidine kinase [Hymenobacter sp. BT770]MCC3153207.1 sensor histidine kinase [Hymenobacter sp. BT770]MDO3415319.1 sensor histidine kinase [Hymenobacter sp. BT770]
MNILQTVFQAAGIPLRRGVFWALAAAFWSSFTLLGYLQTSAYWSLQGGHGLTRTETLDMALRSGLWWLSTPLILYLAHRAPLTTPRRAGRLARHLLLHLGALFLLNLLISGLVYGLLYQVLGLRTGRAWAPDGVWASMLLRLSNSLALYLLLVLVYSVVAYAYRNQALHHQNTRYELANEQLKAQLAGAQLQALKMQLNPHFLFNTHHAIVGLILEQENDRAMAMVTSLSDLLRAVLANGEAQLIPLREELQFVTKYLHIQQIRFQDRLRIELAIDADVRGGLFPQFLLQPLVENAMVHGIEQLAGDALLRIEARREGDQLLVEVHDNGPGATRPARPRRNGAAEGIGLSNTRARLEKLYHGGAHLEFGQPPTGGTVVRLRVPFAEAPAPVQDLTYAAPASV